MRLGKHTTVRVKGTGGAFHIGLGHGETILGGGTRRHGGCNHHIAHGRHGEPGLLEIASFEYSVQSSLDRCGELVRLQRN